MAALTAVIEVAGGGAAAEMTIGDVPDETKTITADAPGLLNTIATIDQEGDLSERKMTDGIETETDVVRQVQENVSRARHPNHNLLRMSVTGEPFLFNSLPLVSAPKS